MDDNTKVVVSAHKDSRAIFLVEFGAKIVAAFQLSKNRGLLIKHLNENSGLILLAYKNNSLALIVLPSDRPFEGHIRAKLLQSGEADQSGTLRINDIVDPRMHVPDHFWLCTNIYVTWKKRENVQ